MGSSKKNILEINNLKTYFDTDKGILKAVDGIDLTVPLGKTVCLVGESGCGKSVTALSIMGLLDKKKGRIADGKIKLYTKKGEVYIDEAKESVMRELRRRDISMIFQEPMTSLNPVYTIGHQLDEAVRLYEQERAEISSSQVKEKTIDLLTKVKIDDPLRVYDMYPHEISGGMRQRVIIAMALASKPRLIIADEPTTALDVTVQAQILELLNDLKDDEKSSILMITHDLGVVSRMADYIYVMYCGRIVEWGSAKEIFKNPKHPYTKSLLRSKPDIKNPRGSLYNIKGNVPSPIDMEDTCYFKDRCEYRCDKCDGNYPEKVMLNEDHYAYCRNINDEVLVDNNKRVFSEHESDEVILDVRNLSKSFEVKKSIFSLKKSYVKAVKNVSFSVKKGETLGLVGESGCGKTTVGKCVLRLYQNITHGKIVFAGEDVYEMREEKLRDFRTKAQMIFQDPYSSLSPRMKVLDIIKEGVLEHKIVPKEEADEYVYGIMEECGLRRELADRYPKDFSGGQRQRICIARALAVKPDFIVCDEPVSALDVSVQAQIINLLKKIQKERGISLLFISHDLSVVEHISDWVMVMYKGKVVEYERKEEIFKNPKKEYTKKLLASVPTIYWG